MVCSDCRYRQPHYDHIHVRRRLPAAGSGEDGTITHGYVVEFDAIRGFGNRWLFFDALEPAVAFAASARSSLDGVAAGLLPAARQHKKSGSGTWEYTLLVIEDERIPDPTEDVPVLRRSIAAMR